MADGDVWEALGEALITAAMNAAFASVEMSSRFSVLSFARDQETLQRAADALRSYFVIGGLWGVGTTAIAYKRHGELAAAANALANAGMMAWYGWSYGQAFQEAAARYNLQPPSVWGSVQLAGGPAG